MEPMAANVQSNQALKQKSKLLAALPLTVEASQLHQHEGCCASIRHHVENCPELGAWIKKYEWRLSSYHLQNKILNVRSGDQLRR